MHGPFLQLSPAPSPTLTFERAVQGRNSLHEPLRSTEVAGEGPFQALETPAVFIQTGEVQVLARAQGAQAYTGNGSAVL